MMNANEPSMSGRQIILWACSASSLDLVAANVLHLNQSVPSDWIPHAQKSIRCGSHANSRNAIRSVPPGSGGALIACTNCRYPADVKNSDLTKNVHASGTAPTAVAYDGTTPSANRNDPIANR